MFLTVLRIRNKIFGSGIGSGSGRKLVPDLDPDPDTAQNLDADPDPDPGGQPKTCIPPGKILGTPLSYTNVIA